MKVIEYLRKDIALERIQAERGFLQDRHQLSEEHFLTKGWDNIIAEMPSCNGYLAEKFRNAIEEVQWYHINKNGELVSGANGETDQPLYKAEDIYNALDNVMPVKLDRWEKKDLGGVEPHAVCSNCGYSLFWSDFIYGHYFYCPYCGTPMEAEE